MITQEKLLQMVKKLTAENIDATNGLPEELFLLVSTLTPIPNVDLFIQDDRGRLLLSWRDDEFYGQGWHIPGGCIRFGETMQHRIQQTALAELGCRVDFDPEPLAVRDVICGPRQGLCNPNMRGHNLTILYRCKLPYGYKIDNKNKTEVDAGYLKWFSQVPKNLLAVHDVYNDILRPDIKNKEKVK